MAHLRNKDVAREQTDWWAQVANLKFDFNNARKRTPGNGSCANLYTASSPNLVLSSATLFDIIQGTMLADIWQYVPQIIKEAATSPLGLLALMIIALAILAFFFFKDAGVLVRVIIFIILFCAVVVFAAKVAYKANEVATSTNTSPTPASSNGTLDENADEPTPRPGSAEDLEQIEMQIDALQR